MKKLLLGLIFLPSLMMGQRILPVRDASSMSRTMDIATRAEFEGVDMVGNRGRYPSGYVFDGTKRPELDGVTPTNAVAQGAATVPPGEAFFVRSIGGWCSDSTLIQINAGTANSGPEEVVAGRFERQFNKLVFGNDAVVSINLVGKVRSTRKILLTWGAVGSRLSADADYDADRVVLIIGDSNTEGTALPAYSSTDELYHWRLKNWYNAGAGVPGYVTSSRVRIVQKAEAGQGTPWGERLRAAGKLTVPYATSGIYNLSTNDTDTAAYRTNLNRFILTWTAGVRLSSGTPAPLIVCGPAPRSSGSASETTMGFLRAIAAQVVSQHRAAGRNHVYFCNLGTAFSSTTDANFVTTDGTSPGNRVHFNTSGGHLGVFQAIRDCIIANNIRL